MEEKRYLKWYNKVGYGAGDFAACTVFATVTAFMTIYLTDTVGLNVGIVGTLIALSKIVEGICGVAIGTLIDRTKSRFGKARPWMFWGYVGCFFALIATFSVPVSWGDTAQYIYFFITYTLLNAVCYAANNIGYSTLLSLISKNNRERVQCGSIRFVFSFGAQMLIQAGTVGLVRFFGGGAAGWRYAAMLYAAAGLIVNTVSCLLSKELPAEDAAEEKISFAESFRLILKNKYYLMVFGVYIFYHFYLAAIGFGIYYMKYILGNEGLLGVFSYAVNLPAIIGLLFAPMVFKKVKWMYKLDAAGYFIAIFARIGVAIAGYCGSIPLMLAFTAVAALAMCPLQGSIGTLVAACADHTYLKTGKKIEGLMFSGAYVGCTVGIALGNLLTGWLMDAAGYVENSAIQSPACLSMISALYLWVPAILCGIVALLLSRLKVERANAELEK